jgi:hypothetical protein
VAAAGVSGADACADDVLSSAAVEAIDSTVVDAASEVVASADTVTGRDEAVDELSTGVDELSSWAQTGLPTTAVTSSTMAKIEPRVIVLAVTLISP